MNLLLVEDEVRLPPALKRGLAAEGGVQVQWLRRERQQEARPQFLQRPLLAGPHAAGAQHESAHGGAAVGVAVGSWQAHRATIVPGQAW